MRILTFQNKPIESGLTEISMTNLTRPLDRLRVALLRVILKNSILRHVYRDRALRLGFNFVALCILYLTVSSKWPILLLVTGPLVFGYPHLVASYRFLQKPKVKLRLGWSSPDVFRLFVLLTLISLGIRFVAPLFIKTPQVPYGTWEILLSVSALGIVRLKLNSIRPILVAALTVLSIGAVLKVAWIDPLAFVGIALIFHNWVGYGHWYLAAPDAKTRIVVVTSTLIFALIHYLVFAGFLDPLISISDVRFLSTRSFEVSGWTLASWSLEPKMWDRALVLYAFGLSLHYFIWLRAIPQSLDKNFVPNSFRRSLELLRADCGPKMTVLLISAAVLIIGIWIFSPAAGPIYFGVAMLHGWLELIFLVVAFYSNILKINTEV